MIRSLLVLLAWMVGVRCQCLDNVMLDQTTSTTAKLSWHYKCNEADIETYKIDFRHKKFKACDFAKKDNTKPSGFGTLEVESSPVVVHNLHPYSDYTFEIRVILKSSQSGRPESFTVDGSTEYSIPRARAQASPIDYSYRNTKSSLIFNWSPPLAAGSCQDFYSRLGSFVYIVQGINAWNKNLTLEQGLDISTTMVEIHELQPFSDYIFFLYIANEQGEYDEDVYLKLEGRTLASEPDPPILLSSRSSDAASIHLTWDPHIPLKGKLLKYELRWKLSTGTDWMGSRMLKAEEMRALCDGTVDSEVTVCYTLNNLAPNNYTLQLRTYNEDVAQPSDWSRSAHVEVKEILPGYFDATNIIIVTCLVILLLAVSAFILYKFKCTSRKKGFDRVLTDDTSRPIIRASCRQPLPAKFSDSNSYVLRPGSTQRSVQDPLPPVPSQENIYSDLKPRPGKTEAELEEEDNYLKPNPARVESCESLDEQGYLRPNFNRFQRMDTSGSDRYQNPHVIPPVSYRAGT